MASQVYILDYSAMCADAGTRGVDKFHTAHEVYESGWVSTLADESFKREIFDWLALAQLGDYKDFGPFTIFVGREE